MLIIRGIFHICKEGDLHVAFAVFANWTSDWRRMILTMVMLFIAILVSRQKNHQGCRVGKSKALASSTHKNPTENMRIK